MTFEVHTGNLFDSGAHTLVNAVNCVGVMGAGLAAQFKARYPESYLRYRQVCDEGSLHPGAVLYDAGNDQHIAHVATKNHWRDNSRIDWVQTGITSLAALVRRESIESLAIPPLGCGLGGLEYHDVLPRIVKEFTGSSARVLLYVSPDHKDMALRATKEA